MKNTLKKLYLDYEYAEELKDKNIIKTKILLLENKINYNDIINWFNNNTSIHFGFLNNEEDYEEFIEAFNNDEEGFKETYNKEFVLSVLNGNHPVFTDINQVFFIKDPYIGYQLFYKTDIHNGLYTMIYYWLNAVIDVNPEEYFKFITGYI